MAEPAPGVGWIPAFVGLGSNLDGPAEQVRRALEALASVNGSRLAAVSRLYRSDPVGPPGQPDYVNAVAKLETRLAPGRLLDELQRIERRQGRVRGERWGPRTLDLDLLLYGDRTIDEPRLRVPHPRLAERSFVLLPLAELLAGDAELPGLGRLDGLLAACPRDGTEPL